MVTNLAGINFDIHRLSRCFGVVAGGGYGLREIQSLTLSAVHAMWLDFQSKTRLF